MRAVRGQGYPVLVIDDGSTDNTRPILSALGVEPILSVKNEGKGASLRKGLERLRESSFKAAVLMDADGQHDVEEISRFVEALEGADLVIGNRMTRHEGMSLIRVATNRFMSWMLSAVAGQKVPDSQCGYRALSRAAIDTIRLRTDRFETESEMILRAADAGLRIVSLPVHSVYRDEISHIRPARDTIRFFKFYLNYLSRRPK